MVDGVGAGVARVRRPVAKHHRLIHVAGTGGKGSTCRFLGVGFGCAGKAGSFMSPHLFDYRERFSVGAEFVSRADVNELWSRRIQPFCVRRALRGAQYVHTFHEVSILLALALFERHEVEWAAMETGVGGRYDQTRALDVVATALTNVGGDHAHLLGREQWQRALDKAGIARRDTPFFTSETDPDTLAIIEAVWRRRRAADGGRRGGRAAWKDCWAAWTNCRRTKMRCWARPTRSGTRP